MGAMSRCLICCAAREAEVTAAQVFITPQFAVRRADIISAQPPFQRGLRDDDPGVTDAAGAQPQQLGGEDDH